MTNEKIIPEGYMTVGQLAKKMGTTVRTLQYYDKEGVLSPTTESEGGRRLYTSKDMIKLHQIQSLKTLGFTLKEIKDKIVSLETPSEVAMVLNEQSRAIQQKINQLSESVIAIEMLKSEVLQMQTVDFEKYADIIVNLQMDNEYYWLIKHFDAETLDHVRESFDKDSGLRFIEEFKEISNKILYFKKNNISPYDERVQALAKDFWKIVMSFTKGDIGLLEKLIEFDDLVTDRKEWLTNQKNVMDYLQPALEYYFQEEGINPFKEV